jgi:hypothetical protein
MTAAGFWKRFNTTGTCLDCELLPWSGMTPVELLESVPKSRGDVEINVETEDPTSMQSHTSSGFERAGSLNGTARGHGDLGDDRHEVSEAGIPFAAKTQCRPRTWAACFFQQSAVA